MHAYRKANRIRSWLLGSLLVAATAAQADFEISEIQPRFSGQGLQVSGTLDLTLNSKVEEAVGKGIPLDVQIHLRLYRKRPVIWAKHLQDWVLRRRIRYHALSGQYLVSEKNSAAIEVENFTSLQQALRHMGALTDLVFTLAHQPEGQEQYFLDARVMLDIESLPPPLRPVAYASLAWRLNSGWTTWKIQR